MVAKYIKKGIYEYSFLNLNHFDYKGRKLMDNLLYLLKYIFVICYCFNEYLPDLLILVTEKYFSIAM